MSIRLARTEDAEAIRSVIQTVYIEYHWQWEPDTYHLDLYQFDEHYLQPGASMFVKEVDGVVVGCGALVTYDLIPGPTGELIDEDGLLRIAGTDCEIMRLYLLKEHRGQGFGKALNLAIIDDAKQRNRKAIEIWSDKRLLEAHQMYQKLGAKPVGDRLCYDVEQSPEWGFILELN